MFLLLLVTLSICKQTAKPHMNHFENIFFYDDEYY